MNETYYGKFNILDFRFLQTPPMLFGTDFKVTISEGKFEEFPQYDKIELKYQGDPSTSVLRFYKNGLLINEYIDYDVIETIITVLHGIAKLEFTSYDTPERDIRLQLLNYGYMNFYRDFPTMFVYLMNSPKNKVTKSLIWVATFGININRVINNKNLIVDVANIDEDSKKRFNYVYLPFMNRYYYVQEISLLKDFTSCSLVEDVLMSFSDLIRLQTAFVERQENNYDSDKVDDLVTFDYNKSITYTSQTDLLSLFTSGVNGHRYTMTIVAKYV